MTPTKKLTAAQRLEKALEALRDVAAAVMLDKAKRRAREELREIDPEYKG